MPSLAAVVAALSLGAGTASAQDAVVTAKSNVQWAKVLGDSMLVASDRPRNLPNRIQRVVAGRLVGASRLTRPGILARVEALGRDRKGRVVVPFLRARDITSDDELVGRRWFLYDVERNTSRRLRGLPGGDRTPRHVAVWRGLTAYLVDGKRPGVYLRDGNGTRRVSKLAAPGLDDPLLLRGKDLVMVAGNLDGENSLWRLVDDGKVDARRVDSSTAADENEFSIHGVWLTADRIDWWMDTSTAAGNLILSTGRSGDLEPAGAYTPVAERPLAVDGGDLYTADGATVNRRNLGAPSKQPPANDAVANAQDISGPLPVTVGARVGFATITGDEPAVRGVAGAGGSATATRTIWFAFRPAAAGPVTVAQAVEGIRGNSLHHGALAVYDDAGTGTLTELPRQTTSPGHSVSFMADPTHRYLIGLGSDTLTGTWPAFSLRITAG